MRETVRSTRPLAARRVLAAGTGVGLVLAAVGVAGALLRPGDARPYNDLHWTGAAIAAAAITLLGWRRAAGPDRRVRAGFAAGMGVWLVAQLAWDLQPIAADPRVRSLADGLYLLSAAPVLLALVRSVQGRRSRWEELSVHLDTVGIFLAIVAALALVVGTTVPHRPLGDLVVPLLYPVLFLAVPAAGVASLLSLGRHRGTGTQVGFLVAFGCLGFAWLAWVQGTLTGADSGTGVAILFTVALVVSAAFAARWSRPAAGVADAEPHPLVALLPVPSVLLSLLVLLLAPVGEALSPVPQVAASLAVGVGVVRQTLLLRERTMFVRRERARIADQRRLLAVNEELLRTASAGPVLDVIADTLRSVVPYDTLTIYLADAAQTALVPVLARDRYADRILSSRLAWGAGITGDAVARGEAALVNDADHDPRATRVPGTPEERESLIVAPLISPDGPLGSLNLYRIDRDFQPEDLDLARLYASQAAIALETANRHGRLSLAARSDPLTGLLNRSAFLKVVDDLLVHRDRSLVAVLFLDLDGFKVVNDSLGHGAGDALLKRVAERLRTGLRPADAIARIGGDEFAVAATVGTLAEAEGLARRLLDDLRLPLQLGELEIVVRASIGIGTSEFASDREAIVRDADAAMYEAKASGKGRVCVFRPEMHERAVERLRLERELRTALERDELVVHVQPVVDLATGDVAGHEALVRWQHPTRGLVLPGAFIPVAEETGLIVQLGALVIRRGVETLAAWRREGWQGWLSVNLAPRQLLDPELPGLLRGLVRDHAIPPGRLHVEITESEELSREPIVRSVLHDLTAAGIGISLDDFGTGYSSLERAAELPISVLKIDRSFVAGLNASRVQFAVAQATISFAHALGVPVIAEGVETADQAETLSQLGCDFAQGFLYGRPSAPPPVAPAEAPASRPRLVFSPTFAALE